MKPVVGIFAHPDDEVFFTGGTLALLAKERPVYLICVTNGDAGENSSTDSRELGEIRKEELLASAKLLGVKEVFFLDYRDGSLSNNLYHEIAEKIQKIVEDIQPETLITFEPRGISGHIDHIAVSMITSFVFEKVETVKEIWYFCFDEETRAIFPEFFPDFFIYLPPGYKKSEIGKVVDITPVWEQKVQAMDKHQSQKHDYERLFGIYNKIPKEEYFLVRKK